MTTLGPREDAAAGCAPLLVEVVLLLGLPAVAVLATSTCWRLADDTTLVAASRARIVFIRWLRNPRVTTGCASVQGDEGVDREQ